MRLRRSLAHRVEVRAPSDQIVLGPEALAASGAIELEDDPTAGPADGTSPNPGPYPSPGAALPGRLSHGRAATVALDGNGGGCRTGRVGHLLEARFLLAIDTLSFLRVGAFALAHCALSLMVVELVSAIDRFALRTTSFVLGQAVIIVVEVLVVSVQVKPRAGRALHPLPSPRRPS